MTSTRAPVMVLNFDGWADTISCISSLQETVPGVWLIDNGSAEDRTGELAAMFPGLRVLRLPENLGWAGGYNRALEIAMAEGYAAAYLLNNDAVLQPGGLEACLAALEATPGAAAIGSVILDEDGAVNFAGEYWMFADKSQREKPAPSGNFEARTLHGAGVLMNLEALKELGLFHEEYFLYWEETDWFVRARQSGWRLLVCGGSEVLHRSEGSDSARNAHYYRARNRFLALRRGVCVSGKPETRSRLILQLLHRAAHSSAEKRAAVEDGLLDGLAGRFGKRGQPRCPAQRRRAIALLKVTTLPGRVWAKVSRIRQPGDLWIPEALEASGPFRPATRSA